MFRLEASLQIIPHIQEKTKAVEKMYMYLERANDLYQTKET